MADHGTVVLLPSVTLVEITGYTPAGTTPTTPAVPTTGQIWPRGTGT